MATVTYTSIGGQIVAENRGGTRKYYSSDALGSTVALYDNSATKTDSFKYWPYGETRTSSGSTPTKYKFSGTLGCRTQADGGIYMRARIEDPEDGRWMTVDPLWPTMNGYRFASCSPELLVDPFGMVDPCDFDRCFYGRLRSGGSPFSACMRCCGLPAPQAAQKCKNFSTRFSDLERIAFFKFFDALSIRCNPCNPHTGSDDCCIGMMNDIAAILQVTDFSRLFSAKSSNCLCDCQSAMKGNGTGGSPTYTDMLKGIKACLLVAENVPSELEQVGALLEVISHFLV